jgi:drug/metabolite transporter (DMT)-like permease
MNSKTLRANLLLLLAAFIWGVAFVAQKSGLDHVPTFSFNAIRFMMGGLVLLPLALFRRRGTAPASPVGSRRRLWLGGILCGFFLFMAAAAQQMGMIWTTAGKAGFLTALYVVIVPLLSSLAGRPVRAILWFCIALAVAGLYLLCLDSTFTVNRGDALELLCALAFALHILLVDRVSPGVDGIRLSCLQFCVCGLLSAATAIPLGERPAPADIAAAWLPLLYTGVLSCGVAYTLQVIAQKNTSPTVASLIMCLESLFAFLAGFLILRDPVTLREWSGAALLLAALLLAQLRQTATSGEHASSPFVASYTHATPSTTSDAPAPPPRKPQR